MLPWSGPEPWFEPNFWSGSAWSGPRSRRQLEPDRIVVLGSGIGRTVLALAERFCLGSNTSRTIQNPKPFTYYQLFLTSYVSSDSHLDAPATLYMHPFGEFLLLVWCLHMSASRRVAVRLVITTRDFNGTWLIIYVARQSLITSPDPEESHDVHPTVYASAIVSLLGLTGPLLLQLTSTHPPIFARPPTTYWNHA